MKIEITLTHVELLQIIADHVTEAAGHAISKSSIRLYVKSKNNYRLKTWEEADLLVTTKPPEQIEPIAADTEIKAEVSQDV